MEIAQGTASHCQNTSRVSGGGNNGTVSTTYISLFRLEQRQVQFSSSSPLSVSDGDRVVVAGRLWREVLNADAVRNVTTGVTKHSGIVSRVFFALFVLLFGAVASWIVSLGLGPNGRWLFLAFAAGSAYLLVRAAQTSSARRQVNAEAVS
ncbi:MAG: hypothetical protein INR65_13195 [Gluconacetobacter diazotrophicus]|nr:hypothetical protein [Gluconacetobacter diazotrophicus]